MKSNNPNLKQIVHDLRRDYSKNSLDEENARKNPFEQFELWLAEAIENNVFEPNAMTLATATPDGKPSSRIVLMRGFDEAGFTFYTNYKSRKGIELEENPHAALLFYWAEVERQVRIEGLIEKVERENSDEYFASRPRESRIGAWTSPQSRAIESRAALEKKFAELAQKWANEEEIERPPDWGGYILRPEIFEFWQGRESRLHDRLLYTKSDSGWKMSRLAP